MAPWREKLASIVLLPAVLAAVGILAYFTFRTTLQVERLRQQSVLEATLGLANEKADRLDQRIIEQDNVIFAIADPARLTEISQRWLPTAQRETPTVRAVLVLDEAHTVVAFASRAGRRVRRRGGLPPAARAAHVRRHGSREAAARRAPPPAPRVPRPELPRELLAARDPAASSPSESAEVRESGRARRYLVVAWYDLGRIVQDAMPALFSEAATPSRVNVVDEGGRIIFGPPLRSGEFTVGVRFPTTLYGWRLQVSPSASDELTARVRNRALLELVMVVLSCAVIVLGVATILLAAAKERRISALKSEFVANVSHELKTPLALVRMFGEMLQSGRVASEAKRQEYLDIIVSESERLSSLIENVLDFARVERGRQAYELRRGRRGRSGGEGGQRLPAPRRVRGHRPGRPRSSRTCRARRSTTGRSSSPSSTSSTTRSSTRPARGSSRVRARPRRTGRIVVRVVDRGPGVPAEERERIFERFVRGSTAAARATRAAATCGACAEAASAWRWSSTSPRATAGARGSRATG